MNIIIRGTSDINLFTMIDEDTNTRIGYVEQDNLGWWQGRVELVDYTQVADKTKSLEQAIEDVCRMVKSYTPKLFLYLVARTDAVDYDEYDSFVTVAPCSEDARHTWPDGMDDIRYVGNQWVWNNTQKPLSTVYTWVEDPYTLEVTLLGEAGEDLPNGQVITNSFNAG